MRENKQIGRRSDAIRSKRALGLRFQGLEDVDGYHDDNAD